MNFTEYYFNEEAKLFAKEVRTLLEADMESIGIDDKFINSLINHLEQKFPSYANFNTAISNELRKFVHADNNYIKKIKSRIHEIITKCKTKFLHDVTIKVEKIRVLPKAKPKDSLAINPLLDGESSKIKVEIPNDYK